MPAGTHIPVCLEKPQRPPRTIRAIPILVCNRKENTMANYLRKDHRMSTKHAGNRVAVAIMAAVPVVAMSATQSAQQPASIQLKAPAQEHFVTSPTQTITLPMQSRGFDDLPRLGHTLVVLDIENLNYTTAPTGFVPDYGRLMARIEAVTTDLQAHAFITAMDHNTEALRRYLAAQNIAPHIRPVQQIVLAGGAKKSANSDNELLLRLGYLLARADFDTVIIGTGDGLLGNSAVNFLTELSSPPRAYTLSVLGATAGALTTECNPLVNGNLYWGQDLMRARQWYGETRKRA